MVVRFLYAQTGEVEPEEDTGALGEEFDGWYWHKVTDEDVEKFKADPWMLGKTYYYNKETQKQIWVHPRVQDSFFYMLCKTHRRHMRGCMLHATSAHHLLFSPVAVFVDFCLSWHLPASLFLSLCLSLSTCDIYTSMFLLNQHTHRLILIPVLH
jgi:hypothetical protein